MEKAWYRSLGAASLPLVLALSGCAAASPSAEDGSFSPAGSNASTPTTAPTAVATTPPLTKAEADKTVLSRYRAYQKAYETAYATGDPDPLAEVTTDPLLSIITEDVQATFKDRKGAVWRFHNLLNPRIGSRSADLSSIVVVDCVRTLGAYKFSAKTGKRIGGTDKSSTYTYQVRLQYDGTTWKAAEARKGKRC